MTKLFQDFPVWIIVLAYGLLSAVAGVLVRNAVKHWLDELEGVMTAQLHRILAHSLPRPAGAAVFFILASMGLRVIPLSSSVETLTKHILPFTLGSLGVIVLMRVSLNAISAYGETFPQVKSTAGMARAITWILGFAFLAVLGSDALGISLAPALTALGVGSLAVALALQDTLSNFFSGVYLILDKPIRPGDFVKLDGGSEGYVETIGWRSTHLRTLAPSLVIVPNATFSKAIITNYRQVNPRLTLATPLEIKLDSDPEAAGVLLGEVVKGCTDIGGVDASQAPFVRFSIGDRGLAFALYCTILPTADGSLVQQEVRKRAIAKLRGAGFALAEPNPFVKKT